MKKKDLVFLVLEKQLKEFQTLSSSFETFFFEELNLSENNSANIYIFKDYFTISFYKPINKKTEIYPNEKELFYSIFDEFFIFYPQFHRYYSISIDKQLVVIHFKPKA